MGAVTDSRTLSSRLRARISGSTSLVLPGAPDALTALIIADVGFEAVYVSGAGVANSQLGVPDVGLVTLSELAMQVEAIRDAITLPIVVDADTGFGDVFNVRRTMQLLERRGANGIQIEDQVFPKRCGHFEGKEVISAKEMVAKIHAATDARRDDETIIIARTDANATDGLNEALDRAGLYVEAGADVIFVEAPRDPDELRAICAAISAPKIVNMVEGGLTPILPERELSAMGFEIILYANAALRGGMAGARLVLEHLAQNGSTTGVFDYLASWDERQRLVRKPQFDELAQKYGKLVDGEVNDEVVEQSHETTK